MKLLFSLLLVTSSLFVMNSCGSAKKIKKIAKDEIRFSLSKGACFGQCPSYKMTITQAGYVHFTGKAFTSNIGKYGKQLSSEQMNSLEKAFADADFDTFDDSYPSDLTDLPNIIIGFHNGTIFREISGKGERPEALLQLQFTLEKIADSDNWTLLETMEELNKNKKPEPIMIKEEVIIEPFPGVLISKWLDSKKSIGVRLIKKIAPSLNYYLITYDQKLISPENFLKLMKDDKEIKTAEFNKKTSQRGG